MIDWDITNVKVWEFVHWNGLLGRSQEDSTNQRLSIGVSFGFDILMTMWINMVYVSVCVCESGDFSHRRMKMKQNISTCYIQTYGLKLVHKTGIEFVNFTKQLGSDPKQIADR